MGNQVKLLEKMESYAKKDVCIAFSGGVDSSLLLKIACDAAKKSGTRVYAVTFHTVLHPGADLEYAKSVAKEAGAEHVVIEVNEFDDQEIRMNPKDRCYRCKKMLFTRLMDFAREKGAAFVMEGTNEDDLHVYRPGIQAIRELLILSPLADAGLTKKEVRELASKLLISAADRPSAPCLATRLPYGTMLDPELLRKIELGEAKLKLLGFQTVRLRVHGDIVRLEFAPEQLELALIKRDELVSQLRKLGFLYITIDLEGFCTGSMDR